MGAVYPLNHGDNIRLRINIYPQFINIYLQSIKFHPQTDRALGPHDRGLSHEAESPYEPFSFHKESYKVARMKILLIGSGGREHALGRKICADDPRVELHSAPGNPGLAELGPCHATVRAGDVAGLVALADHLQPDLVLVGPEEPLTLGLADRLRDRAIPVFGPSQIGAQLEASKSFAKQVMVASGVPTGRYERFDDLGAAMAALPNWPAQLVVKADGLAAGKGVVVCDNHGQAQDALYDLAALGQPLLLEERLEGPEISLFALVHGDLVVPLTTAQDHKRVGEGDTGPNTGGMGAYSPGILPNTLDQDALIAATVRPIAQEMSKRGTPFSGVLFVGLMLTTSGPKVLEYNVRFGDPECQVLMARLKSPLIPLIQSVLKAAPSPEGDAPENANPFQIEWHDQAAMTVVLAAAGYPGPYEKGAKIDLPTSIPEQSHVIHAGTKRVNDILQTNGGRVINAVGLGQDLEAARDQAYALAKTIHWDGRFFRNDIGWRAIK